MAEIKFPNITETLPVWMNKGEPLTLAHASRTWWQRVASWLAFPLAQIDVDTCDEQLLALLAYQRDIERFEGESLDLLRLRVKYAFVNARDAGSIAGFARIFERLEIGQIQQLERQLQYEWDVILIRINDAQLARDNTLMMKIIRQYGRTCRRYFFDVLNEKSAYIHGGCFDNDAQYWSARAIVRPTSVTATPARLSLAPGDSGIVIVEVFPEDAEDRSFTVHCSDNSKISVVIKGSQLIVTGKVRGDATITIATNDGNLTAVVNVSVVAVLKFVTRIDNPSRPLFYVRMDEDFTIDYGDGIDSREYRFDAASAVYGWVIPTRSLEAGQEYTITVKNTESASFQRTMGNVSVTLNPVQEIILLTGERDNLVSFASGATGLYKVHAGAFDDLPNIQNCNSVFRGCSSLTELPEGLFARITGATNFSSAFYGCTALAAVPDGLFSELSQVTLFTSVFENCTRLLSAGKNTFRGCAAATHFTSAFSGCTSLIDTGAGIFDGCVSGNNFGYTFDGCRALTTLSEDLFSDVPGGVFTAIFRNCTALTQLPPRLFRNCLEATHFGGAFSGCTQLLSVPDEFFKDLPLANHFGTVFSGCSSLVKAGKAVFSGCALAQTFSSAFYYCRVLEDVGDDIFEGCVSATTFASVFNSCTALTALPSFVDCNKATSFDRAFYACSSLTAVRAEAFAGKSLVTTFYYAFTQCTSLKSIGAGAFRDCSSLTNLTYTFMGCTALVSLAGDMFAGCSKVTNVTGLFNQCSGLAVLPEKLFSDLTSLTAMGSTFQDCTALAALPSDLFAGCVNLTSLTLTFSGCTALARLPADLLKHNTLLISAGSTFYGCAALVNIPPSLFASCPLISAFGATFQNTGVVEIPENLFSGNPLVTAYGQTFRGCKNLRSVPAGVFVASINATTFTNVFAECVALEEVGAGLLNTVPATTIGYLFDGCPQLKTNVSTIFNLSSYSTIVTTTATFRGCSAITGKGLEFMGKVPNVTAHYYAFYNCTSLDDFADLPGNWITNKL